MKRLLIITFSLCAIFSVLAQNEPKVKNLIEEAFEKRDRASINEFVMLCGSSDSFVVGNAVVKDAYQENKYLNESILFYTKFLKDHNSVRDFLCSPHFNGQYSKTNSIDGETIHYTHFNRGSNTLLVIGGGASNQEMLSPFVQMFPRYDVVLFNHRGIEFDKCSIFNPLGWSYCVSSACILNGLHGSKMQFGKVEENDVLAVIFDLFKKKAYDKVYGLATCYSAPIFIKTAIVRPGIFDKLIIDGGWMSVQDTFRRFITEAKERFRERWFSKVLPDPDGAIMSWLGGKLSGINFDAANFDFVPYVQQLSVPVLFFHSANDVIVPNFEFINMWNQVPSTEKAVVLTLCKHLNNHLKMKEFYKYSAEAFFDLSFGDFVKKINRV